MTDPRHADVQDTRPPSDDKTTASPSSGRIVAVVMTAIALAVVMGLLAVATSKQADVVRATSVPATGGSR